MHATPCIINVKWSDHADQSLGLPAYETLGAAGCDIRANFKDVCAQTVLAPFERALITTGLCIELPTGFEAQIRPRSGLALKQGLTLLNSPGTIDCDYRGEIGVLMINLSQEEQRITHGQRIAQMVISPVIQAGFQLTKQLSDTSRGQGGFGSTGHE